MDFLGAAGSRLDRGSAKGHYESWFIRANRADAPEAFWIRYTMFVPRGSTAQDPGARGELWAIWFDGSTQRHVAVKSDFPLATCTFAPDRLDVGIDGARLDHRGLVGAASSRGHTIRWDLEAQGGGAPLLLLSERLYDLPFPKAKALVLAPNAALRGRVVVDGVEHTIDGWIGSVNHNWGSKHTDLYAWGQVAGFDDAPDAFLECATARLRVGPVLTPPLTTLALRLGGETISLNSLPQAIRASGTFEPGSWAFASATRDVSVHATFFAPLSGFVGLTYPNPPGGAKTCLNSKIAMCDLRLERAGRPPLRLRCRHRAAFEILTDDTGHGVPLHV